MADLSNLLPTVPHTRAEWQELVNGMAKKLAELEAAIQLQQGWMRTTPGFRQVLEFAEMVVREARKLVEGAQVPFAMLADIQNWQDISEKAQLVRDNTTLRAFDPDLEYGMDNYPRWQGRVARGYLPQIRTQNAAVVNVMDVADKTATSLARCLTACFATYGAWAILVYQLATWLLRVAVTRDPSILASGSDWATIGRLYLTAEAITRGQNVVAEREAQRLRNLVTARPGLSHPSQPRPGSYGVDRNWPNPFNDRRFIRVEIVNGQVRPDGGPPLAINRVP